MVGIGLSLVYRLSTICLFAAVAAVAAAIAAVIAAAVPHVAGMGLSTWRGELLTAVGSKHAASRSILGNHADCSEPPNAAGFCL